MKEYINFPAEEFKELNRQLYTFYKYFSTIASNLAVEDKRSYTPSESLQVEVYPWQTYTFRDKDVKINIHRNRKGDFSIEALGIVLTKAPPALGRLNSDYRFANYYGNFDSLSDAISKWRSIVKQYVTAENGEFF